MRCEVRAAPNDAIHSVAFTAKPLCAEVTVDSEIIFAGIAAAGACNIVQPGQSPRGIFVGPWKILHLYLPDALLRTIISEDEFGLQGCGFELINTRWTRYVRLRAIADQVCDELMVPQPFSRLKIDSLGYAFAVELLRHHSTLKVPATSSRPTGLAPWQLKRTTEVMEARLDADISLRDLAKVAGCSPTHFSRAFKHSTGMPPFQWLNERRIQKAKELLADPRHSLADIALAVGFSAQPQFTTAFGRATGTTPGRWRRERLS